MTENATEEMMAMARRVAKGLGTDLPFHLREWAEKAVLAAIIKTQRRDAEVAETLPIGGGGTLSSWINANESPMGATRRHIATAIRSGKQYGKE